MQDLFSDLQFDYDILTDKQYEKSTGNKIDTQENKQNNCLLKVGKFINSTETDTIINIAETDKKDGIGVIKTSTVKSSNDFLNKVQDNENRKREQEIKRIEKADLNFPYIRTELLTNAEKQLYYFMRNYLDSKDRIVIFPKVRLADLVEVDNKLTLDKKYLYKIASKHVDFLICKYDTLEVICVVELDDYTHDTPENKERDIFIMQTLYNVGIDVIRIKVPIKTICKADLEFLDEKINTVLAPNCPYCGTKMVPKKSMHKSNRGHRFFSCPNFINGCRHTINIDLQGEKLP